MIHAVRKYQKSAIYVLVAFLILGVGFSTFAQFTDNAYVVRTVHIFPSEVSSSGWENAATLNFQNLDEYALLQDFNDINSATLGASAVSTPATETTSQTSDTTTDSETAADGVDTTQSAPKPETAAESPTTTTTTDQDIELEPATTTVVGEVDESEASQQDQTPAASATPTTTSTDQTPQEEGSVTQSEVDSADGEGVAEQQTTSETESTTDTESNSTTEVEDDSAPTEETGTTTVLREVRSLFAYAVDTITETFSSTSPDADEVTPESGESTVQTEPDATTTEATPEEDIEESDVTFGFVNEDNSETAAPDTETVTATESATVTTSSPTVAPTATQEATQLPESVDAELLATSTEETTAQPESSATTSASLENSEQPAETETATSATATSQVAEFDLPAETASTTAVSDCGADCSGHVLRLANFGYPLEDGVEVSGAQLRMSFAAKHKQIRDTLPAFTMNYSFDGGATWSTGGSIVIEDEVSNSINGGYFLFALPAIDESVSLTDLQVELRYDEDPALLSDLYVESAWLELFVLEPPSEPTTPEFKALLEDDGFNDTNLSGDRLVVSDNEVIDFDFTDDNTDETLIIKSSKKTYDGLSQTTTHFSVTNTSDQSDDFTVQTYFPQNMGEVTDLSVFNLNKPRNTVIPEYRPYVYHCEAGWDEAGASVSVPTSLADLSIETASGTEEIATASSSTTTTTSTTPSTATTSQTGAVVADQSDTTSASVLQEESAEVSYSCGVTNVVRSCETLEGDGTACVVTQKVRDHDVIQYAPGWEPVTTNEGEMDQGGVLKRAAAFLGFGPDRKDVPESFEGRVHTDGTFAIAPGETKYFKMDISYPAFSSGEYWIEVIGDSEYGLLDPFWSSLWRYRKPITIDNTSGAELTEQQFFLELSSADSDFWTNVQADGGDIRFVSETPGNDLTWWDTNWEKRVQITIPAASVDEDLADFPVFVDLNTLGSEFFTEVTSDGRDIRVLDDAGIPNEQAYDLVAINPGAETGELHFKAANLSSSTDNVFYLYFDNPSASAYAATDTYGSQAVWTNNFDLRYALDDNPASSGQQLDSTNNGNDATSYSGMTSGDVVTGQIGEALNLDGNDGGQFGTSLPYAGEFTASMWWRSSGDGFAISRNAGATTKFGTWTGGNVFTRVVNDSDTTLTAPADGTWAHVVLTRDSADKVDVYIDGVPTRLFGDGAQAGLSDWENFGGQTSQGFQGDLDELRFANVKRSDGWVSTEFNNQSDPSSFYTTAAVEPLAFSSFVELDHWVQHFDHTNQEADIWVQVDTIDAAASTTIQLYYGNATAESESDEYAPFTYSTSTDLYYVVNDGQSGDIVVYSYIDNNVISIDGGTSVTLQSGETTSFSTPPYTASSVISANGPITTRTTDSASEPVVPISFATTTFAIPSSRGNEIIHTYAPFADAFVETFDGADTVAGASGTTTSGTAAIYADANNNGTIVEASSPILTYFDTPSDSFVSYPPTLRDLYGIHSNQYYYTPTVSGTALDILCSGGSTGSDTGITRGAQDGNNICTNGAQGTGNAVRLANQTSPISAIQQADSDGTESSVFLPEPEFGTRYIVPQAAEYVSIACSPRFGGVDVEVQTAAGATLSSGTCSPSGSLPGALNFTPAADYTAGSQIVSTNGVPFYLYYEFADGGRETNTWSAVQAKKYNSLYASFTVGAQEVNTDAQYEQNNFRWYENVDSLTPIASWPAEDGTTVAEGEAIATGGAVNPSDQLRLRMNLLANNGTGTVDSTAFELQYTQAETCSAVAGDAWTAVAPIGSTTAAFTGFNNPSIADGDVLPSTLLSDSAALGSYEEQNVSAFLPNQVNTDEAVEFDWVIEVVSPEVNTQYCFRMVRASTGSLATYATYPQLLTAGPPGQSALLTPFDNEHATSTTPNFTFVASDVGGDALDYEIEIATDEAFSSIVETADSGADPFDFENQTLASDKAPFNNGQTVRYLISTPLTNGQTYWWRVRAIDTDGSNTYGAYSAPRSFTVNTAVTVSEWFQTTADQFETNSLSSATTSSGGSVELDIAGSNLVGEYGTVALTNGATSSVSLNNSFTNPVVVASIRYPRSITSPNQPALRVFNKTGLGFDIIADNFSKDSVGTSTADYVVVEAGDWLIDDGANGFRIYATSTSVSTIDGNAIATNPGGPVITYPTSFSAAPAVLTMVTTNNDPQWVVSSVYDGNNIDNPPTASQVGLYLNDNLDSNGHGSAEDIDVVVFDVGDGLNNTVNFVSQTTAADVSDTPNTKSFTPSFGSVPGVTLVQQLTMFGGQGGYAQVDLDTPATASNVTVSIEEGGSGADRGHANESVAIVAFESGSGDLVRSGNAQMTSTPINYNDVVVGNAWGEVSWNDTGDVTYRIQYQTGGGFQDVPDSALPGNTAGFTSSPVNILDLDTDTYNELRLVAELSGVSPEVFDWTVSWGQRVNVPTLGDPFDNEKTPDTTPQFDFTTNDPQGDDLEYEISYSTDPTFATGSTTINSSVSSGDFANLTNGGDTSPFNSGDQISYTIPPGDALTDGETYWWRVRAKDPSGSDSFSPWSEPDNFTVDTATVISSWFQTTQDQFREGVIDGVVASTSNSVELSNEIGEYGTTTLTDNNWQTINTELTYDDMVVVASPKYGFNGTDNGRTVQVRNKTADSFEIKVDNYTTSLTGVTEVNYIVMGAGDWVLDDGAGGMRVVAGTETEVSTVNGRNITYSAGPQITFSPSFSVTPGGLSTVSSANGSKWVSARIDDGTEAGEITAGSMYVSLGSSLDNDTTRVPEDVDYIAFAPTAGTNNGVLFDTFNSADSVTAGDTAVPFNQSFGSTPGLVVVQNNGMDGGDGGSAIQDTDTPTTATTLYASIVEHGPGAGGHTAEIISVFAFADSAGTILRDSSTGGGLTGTIASEEILFSDGVGPKFDRAVINATTPGASTVSIQVEYQTATGSWALIPDGDFAGNSTGFTSATVDLSGIDVGTYQTIRLLGTLSCDSTDCPTLDDWAVEWSEGVTMSGTLQEFDRLTNVSNATVTVSVNGGPAIRTGTVSAGVWSISSVTAFAGDTVTVFVSDVPDAEEAVGVFVYDGLGDMTGVELFEGHLSFSSDEISPVTLGNLAVGDSGAIGDEDVFFDVDGSGNLAVCGAGSCSDASLYIGPGNNFTIATSGSATVSTHDFTNDGTVAFGANTMEVSGSWFNNATTSIDTSTIVFTATTATETLDDVDGLLDFYNVTFGQTSGAATWTMTDPMDVNGSLAVDYGTLDRTTLPINVAGSLSTGGAGFWSGIGTTTFDGSGSAAWTDANPTPQNIGDAVIDGSSRTVLVGSDVRAQSIAIGTNDRLNAGGSNDIFISGNFVNTNVFTPQSSRLVIDGVATDAFITTGSSNLYSVRASSTGGSVSFTESAATLLGDLSIATGTITLPTDVLNIAGSFTNEAGVFAHNNAEVNFTGSGSKTIALQGTAFLNGFYDVRFSGGGNWTFLDTVATTTNTWTQTNGSVTLPSGTLTVGRNFSTTGSGSFAANGGEVVFLARSSDTITTNGSAFYDVRIREGSPVRGGDFDGAWLYRDAITINAASIDDDLTDFPVYLDLADFDPAFFTNINVDGGDIRITESDGVSEVPVEIVDVDTGAETGELYFKAPTLSSTTNSTFYIYYGNAATSSYAIDATNGAENVWNNEYEAVYHLEETGSTYLDSTSNSVDGTGDGTTVPTAASGRFGNAQSITNGRIDIGTDLTSAINVTSEYTISTWINQNTSAGDQALVAQFTGAGDLLFWGDAGGSPGFCNYMGDYMPSDCQSVTTQTPGTWQSVVARYDGTNGGVQVNGSLTGAGMTAGTYSLDPSLRWSIGSAHGDADARQFNGLMDEVRISSIDRGEAWISAEFTNMDNTSSFYTITSGVGVQTRSFADTNATISNDLVIESARAQFPTGNLFIGGSFDNNSEFTNSNGTVVFNATSTGQTVAAGSSVFYDLSFDGVDGGWNVIENATATNAIELSNGDDFTVDSGVTLESTGTFFSQLSNASTTWAGSTLRLSGLDHVINDKVGGGDDFATLTVVGDTDISMWNSTAAVYDTQATSSIYSQDHDGVDGDLYVYGDYQRTTGTEYWSYATDFDGTDLTGGSERAVTVRVASSTVLGITNASLSIQGSSTALTDIDAIANSYSLELTNATLNAHDFIFAGAGLNGLQLLSSTTIAGLTNGTFVATQDGAAVTVDASTVEANGSAQYQNISFSATSFAATGGVVTTSGGVTTHTFTSNDTFSVTSGSTDVSVVAVGAGGGGGNPVGNGPANAGAGGGGGAFAQATTTVSGGQSFSVTVGQGGLAETNGSDSVFGAGSLVQADGGAAGVGTTPGAGGAVASSIGDVRFQGGDGAQRGGGGAAGTGGAGGNAVGDTGGAGTFEYGGAGADGSGNTPGANGSAYGGGASGGRNTGNNGGAGADGVVVVSYPSGGANTFNVSLDGTTSDFIWFRNGGGSLYGEDFDLNDTDPGSIRWDDSNYSLTISGTVYSDNGVTTFGNPTCNGSDIVRIVVDGGTYTDITGCTAGAYSFTGVPYVGDSTVTVYLDSGGGEQGAVVTRSLTDDVPDLDIYANQVLLRTEGVDPLTIDNIGVYDETDDTDLNFLATNGAPDTLTVRGGTGLFVTSSSTFTPGGNITLESNNSGASYDGTLQIGAGSQFMSTGLESHTIGGSFFNDVGSSFTAASSTVNFTSTSLGNAITNANASTLDFNELNFTGVGGEWSITADITLKADMNIAAGTVTGTGGITMFEGELVGNGLLDMTGGTVEIQQTNTLGGTNAWTFNNLTLGSGGVSGITTPASNATTTVRGVFTIAAGHFFDAGSSTINLSGDGTVFVETGTFLEDTSTVQYSGATPTVLATAYYDLLIDDAVTSVAAVAPPTGLQVLNNLTIGTQGTASLNLTTNDPLTSVAGDLMIGGGGTLIGSDSNTLQVLGDWTNDGLYTANGGTVAFNSPGAASISPGTSAFATTLFNGSGPYTMLANATATDVFNLDAATTYTQQSGTTLAVGGQFINQTDGVDTTWTNTTLSLYGGQAYEINTKNRGDSYEAVVVAANTHPRLWNSSFTSVTTATNGSLYAMNHDGVMGDLYIYGDYINDSFADSWSYGNDFDGTPGADRQANVYVEGGGSVSYTDSSLEVFGDSSASTTVQSFGAGTYDLTIGGTASTSWRYAVPRDIGTNGISFTGTPAVGDFSLLDLLVEINGASAVTVAGSVIDANPAKNFTNDTFNSAGGVTGAINVTATGGSVSSWRFANGSGNLEGELFDADSGDPGEIVWEDSSQEVTIAGTVYSDEGITASAICDGSTNNIVLRVAGLTTYTGTCASGTGAYSIPSVVFSANDTLTLYIDGEAVQAANVSIDPASNISNMDLYEDRVIVRHEGLDPLTIADMAVWDSSDDADIPFTAMTGSPDSLTLPVNTKLIVWNSKTFEPQGDVTVGDSVELFANAQYVAANSEIHSVGASFIAGTGAILTAAESEFIFNSVAGGQTIDLNEASLHDVSFTGAGTWTITDPTFTANNDVTITAGSLTLPTGTTTIAGSFDNTGGSFDATTGSLIFTAADSGNTIEFGGSDANLVQFNGIGSWSFTDVNATATDSFTVATGTVTLPSDTLVVGEDFVVNDSIAHNGGTIQVIGTSGGNVVTLGGNDLTNLTIAAPAGSYTLTDVSAALLGDLTLTGGSFTVGTGTVSIGGSFDASGGTYNNGTGTLLFNSTDGGEFIDPGTNDLYNVVIAGSGGWNIVDNATTTNNFSLTNASTFSLTSGATLYVGGVFTNTVSAPATTWTGTTLVLDGSNEYEINNKSTGFELYGDLVFGENTDISSWNTNAASVVVPSTSSWYSQDHGASDGSLNIYGDYHIGTTTEYWSANTDFDGAAIGLARAVTVSIASSSVVTVDGGTLEIIGTLAASTTIQNQGSGTYTFIANDGTLNANHYNFNDLATDGLQLLGSISIPSLSNGYFTQAANGSDLITLVSSVVNNNASLVITDTGFATGGFSGGANVTLDATTTNSWNFTGELGDFWGEDFDVDGFDACSSIRWDDSDCLLTEQTNYRWRNDDGGEGAPDSEWYDTDWTDRQRLRVINNDATAYASTAVKVTVPYDADMQTDFEDLRFTDSDGVTLINHWIERVTAADNAIVWIQVPALAANDVSEVYMYYGNVVAADLSDGSSVFAMFEDFEDNNISEYAGTPGDLSLFSTDSTFAYGGGFGLDTAGNESGRTTNGITRTDISTEQGQNIRFMQYIDTTVGSGDEVCTIFASVGVPADRDNYAVCVDQVGTDRVSIAKDVKDTELSGTILGTANFTSLTTGWYEFLIDWETDNTIDVVVREDSTGTVVATTTATDSTYSTGGIGFAYWFQNGGWDSFVAWPRTDTTPTVFFGDKQSDGGASWAGAQNTPTGGFAFGETARLRVVIENSGLPIENQRFRLEYAPKLTAPTCEAVNVANYDPVPNVATCGSDAVCMSTSPNVSDGDATTDHLVTAGGDFLAGSVVTSPNNRTANFDLGQNRYTELEYAVNLTVNATNDSYCFRVTDDGAGLDSYSNLPELTLAFDPVITDVTLNDGLDIVLIPGATTTITASSTVTDFNGTADLANATTTFYTTSAGALCTPDDNNCYVATSSCSFTNCTGTSCSLQCTAPFAFHADPTDDASNPDEWFAFMEVSDQSGGVDLEGSIGVELLTMRALDVQNDIAYGPVDINENTGSFNPMVSLLNIGNEAIDVTIGGTDMTDGAASVIPASQQFFATSTFSYTTCIGCQALSVVGADVEVDLPKPLASDPAVTDQIYWGIEVPFGTNSTAHTGVNSFTAISDE